MDEFVLNLIQKKIFLQSNQLNQTKFISMPVFNWSIFIRAVIDHMTCYNLNWPKIKLSVHYFFYFLVL
jgi:hypothetical protein